MAEFADRRIKASRKEFYDEGRLTDHHRFMLRLRLRQYDDTSEEAIAEIDKVDAAIAQMDAEVPAGQATFRFLIALLSTIPGIKNLSARTILAEIGTDMGRFPTAGHLLSWAGLWQNESAGKLTKAPANSSPRACAKGLPVLKTLMVQCGWAAARKKDSYYTAQFNRLRGRHGAKTAVCTVAASMLTAIYLEWSSFHP